MIVMVMFNSVWFVAYIGENTNGFILHSRPENGGHSCFWRKVTRFFNDARLRLEESNCFAWHISDLKVYSEPRKPEKLGAKRPSRDWYYVTEG